MKILEKIRYSVLLCFHHQTSHKWQNNLDESVEELNIKYKNVSKCAPLDECELNIILTKRYIVL